jgi:FkbH-like protein
LLDAIQSMTDASQLLRTSRKTIRELRSTPGLRDVRIAVLGGSTTHELLTFLEIFLLKKGIAPVFWESEYGRYYEDAVLDSGAISAFNPDLIYVFTTNRNIRSWPQISDGVDGVAVAVKDELTKLSQIWDALQKVKACPILQNNFEMPATRLLGNLDSQNPNGATHFVHELNGAIAAEAAQRPYLMLCDLHYLSAQVGLRHWYDQGRWFSYKIATSAEGSMTIAANASALIAARYGLSKKCLVLDLDNTLWGGVIGDDGADRIVIGRETAAAEAYTAFQEYCRALKHRGVLLAVSSKNTEKIAQEGFSHPDSILSLKDFACFKANWEPKHENIRKIAEELNIGLDSLVFVDDNPAERALVAGQLPMVMVPEVGEDVADYAQIVDRSLYFEPLSLSEEDLRRGDFYASKNAAADAQTAFSSYQEYLEFLQMTAEIDSFTPMYLDRITQLTNKSNQFNLTTRRYSISEISDIAADPAYVTLYVKLSDRFGDHGLISVIIGKRNGSALQIDLWLMSCRVLKRRVEETVLDELAARAQRLGLTEIRGTYLRTPKNDMVSGHYESLGFLPESVDHDRSEWILPIDGYEKRNHHIAVHPSSQQQEHIAQ